MTKLQTKLPTDTWVMSTWKEYLDLSEELAYEKAKCYYYEGKARIEMSPVGSDHSKDHTINIVAVSLYASIKGIPCTGHDNCTYRKTGKQEAQPDVSFYIGTNANVIPWGTSVIDLDSYPPPNLVIEIANTSLADDRGEKRLLYEELEVDEYWIVDVQNVRIIAFAIQNQGSRRISQSQVFPGLNISLLEEALQRTRQINQSQVVAWLLNQFQD